MALANLKLTELQRQQLLEVLGRRFQKMPDSVLVELERLTRHPVDLTGFEAKNERLLTAKAENNRLHNVKTEDVIDATVSQPVNRREFLSHSASALLGLLLCGAGYGWWNSNESVEDLSDNLSDVTVEIGGVLEIMRELQTTTASCTDMISEFADSYQQAAFSVAQLREHMYEIQNLYNILEGTGISIAEIAEFIVNVISLFPNAEKYTSPVNAMLDLVKNAPETVFVAGKVCTDLEPWFSDQQGQGINSLLFAPTQSLFLTIDTKLYSRLQMIAAKLVQSQ